MYIREFSITDYEAVIEVWVEAGLALKPSDELPWLIKKLERDHDLFLIAEERGQIFGAVMGAWDGRQGWIYHLAVAPLVQRQGIGLQLMEEVEKRLRQRGALEINLLVEGSNTQVVPFYQRLGFQIDNKVLMRKSLYASKLIMRQDPVMEEDACQAQKGCRYDEAGHQGSWRVSQSAFWHRSAAIHASLR